MDLGNWRNCLFTRDASKSLVPILFLVCHVMGPNLLDIFIHNMWAIFKSYVGIFCMWCLCINLLSQVSTAHIMHTIFATMTYEYKLISGFFYEYVLLPPILFLKAPFFWRFAGRLYLMYGNCEKITKTSKETYILYFSHIFHSFHHLVAYNLFVLI